MDESGSNKGEVLSLWSFYSEAAQEKQRRDLQVTILIASPSGIRCGGETVLRAQRGKLAKRHKAHYSY